MGPFFVRRPTVAIVISILMLLVGAASFLSLPVEQYPSVSPPTIRVEGTYPGAGAEVVEESVATPLEQQINGVDNMIYMKSLNTSDGRMLLDVTFQVGMDLDMANVLTQNRVSQAQSRLPAEVVQQGVTVKKINPSILMIISLYSPQGTYDSLFLSNYAMINLRDNVLRVPGVSSVDLLGGFEYGMRVWFKPDRLAEMGLEPQDVVNAIKEQNLQAPAGQVGAAPSPPGQQQTYTVRPPSRLSTPEEFGEILVRTSAEGAQVRLKDVASVELGSEFYKSFGRICIPRPQEGQTAVKGSPAAMLMVYLLPGANQLESAEGIYEMLRDQRALATWPEDLEYTIVYDTTPAVEASLESIKHTFIEALLLVVLVVFVFLQNVRATIIPLLTIPVSIVGTFVFFPLVGFSVNTLSMFGLILAIGIVVDDAIVVVEAVMHHIEHGMKPREATLKALEEVTGPVIGIALILTAVFVPVGFLGGLTGSLYKQFAITIAISVLISAFNALSLTPALCAMFLRAPGEKKGFLGKLLTPISAVAGLGGKGFNKVFGATTTGYVALAKILIRRSILALAFVAAAGWGSVQMAGSLPKGFVPEEDQGIFLVNCQLPAAASQQRTDALTQWAEDALWDVPGIEAFNTIGGMSFLTNSFADNVASFAVKLRPWDEREDEALHVNGVLDELRRRLSQAPEGQVFPFLPPTLPGFGAAGGVSFLLQDKSGRMTSTELGEASDKFLAAARQRPEVATPFTAFDPKVPQVAVDLDREMARTMGVPVSAVFAALQTAFGSSYVNDFNRFGRLYRVKVQAEPSARQRSEDIGKLKVRSQTTGEMVPLGALVKVKENQPGTEMTVRFNLLRSVEMSAVVKPGFSSGQAMEALEAVAKETLPPSMGITWSGLSYQEQTAPPSGPTFILAIIFVFLLLAAMYESWGLPFAVLLGSPFVAVGAFAGVMMAGFANDVFVQIGLVMLIGLAAKNSILIVEFAKMKKDGGMSASEAAIESARLRFRPILMTAFAFILGVVPLVIAKGSGAASRQAMGTAVFWGMLVATFLGVLVTPALYAFISWFERKKAPPAAEAASPPEHAGDEPTQGGH